MKNFKKFALNLTQQLHTRGKGQDGGGESDDGSTGGDDSYDEYNGGDSGTPPSDDD